LTNFHGQPLTFYFTLKNFCLEQIELKSDGTASESIIQDNVDVAIHEAAHVLGMSSNSYRFFWDSETGSPRTPRPFETSTVTCVDGVNRSLIIPSEDTMQFFVTDDGDRYASIVTPKVRTIARNQFNCQSMAGAQLENQPTGTESCTGDHWDERQ
jgi:Leishmanolysin